MLKPDLAKLKSKTNLMLESDAEVVTAHLLDGRVVRWKELVKLGVSANSLAALTRRGDLQRIGWGTYQLSAELRPSLQDSETDIDADEGNMYLEQFAEITPKTSGGVICMMSAVAYHDLSLDVPHEVWIGLQHGRRAPRIEYPPLKAVSWRNEKALTLGVETRVFQGTEIPITNLERTVIDIYRYSSRLPDPTLPRKVLKAAMEKPGFSRERLGSYARSFQIRDKIFKDVELVDMIGNVPDQPRASQSANRCIRLPHGHDGGLQFA
ncbi:type IV toxin-antitoxin system AbiEi family antitoxin domain-containing protein [Salipiger sp. PrR003]|uniref:type IV toxin-antitoxin system AbiEi family antitoxin domain-containing protein n=1 Tax=Salipiger sp. PrR003 TaxID=2706776 RepID=UPI0013D94DE3|nr:type IV toxin-antitoxin system AbiEi family antitoxin domain-containing protein [Salipiger sp. PrR003]NDV52811.1 hypothetical protein [Salipiger sp. PrR003]